MTKSKSTQACDDPYFEAVNTGEESKPIPEAIAGEATCEAVFNQGAYFSQSLLMRLKYPLIGVGGLAIIGFLWQMVDFYHSLLSIHWLLAMVFWLVLVLLAGTIGWIINSYLKNIKALDTLKRLRMVSERMRKTQGIVEKKSFIHDFKKVYRWPYHQSLLSKTLVSMPDYYSDSEAVKYLDDCFLADCDQQAQAIVIKCCRDTAVMMAFSPFASADIGLSLWRTLKMIDDISQIYGITPSLPGRIKLTNCLVRQMALTAGADLVTDQLVELMSNRLIGTLSKQAGTAFGVSLYIMRIGFHCMALCRPVAFHNDNKPHFKQALMRIMMRLKSS